MKKSLMAIRVFLRRTVGREAWPRWLRYITTPLRRRRDFPNKCDYCGLRVQYRFSLAGQSQTHDEEFHALRKLYLDGVVNRKYRRKVKPSSVKGNHGSSEICAVGSAAWLEDHKACKYWTPRLTNASLPEYLRILHDRQQAIDSRRLLGLTIVLLVLTAILAIGELPQVIEAIFD